MLNTQKAKATSYDNTRQTVLVCPTMTEANNASQQTRRKRGSRSKTITIVYANEMPAGILEQALADIYIKKIRNGTLEM